MRVENSGSDVVWHLGAGHCFCRTRRARYESLSKTKHLNTHQAILTCVSTDVTVIVWLCCLERWERYPVKNRGGAAQYGWQDNRVSMSASNHKKKKKKKLFRDSVHVFFSREKRKTRIKNKKNSALLHISLYGLHHRKTWTHRHSKDVHHGCNRMICRGLSSRLLWNGSGGVWIGGLPATGRTAVAASPSRAPAPPARNTACLLHIRAARLARRREKASHRGKYWCLTVRICGWSSSTVSASISLALKRRRRLVISS